MYNRSLSMMKFLLVAVVIAQILCGSSADSDFFLVGSDLTTCLRVSKLHTAHCNKDDDMELHCVLDEDGQLGIGYLKPIWVPRGSCPFYRKDYDVLDYRPCVTEASACPNTVDQYLSNDVYKYPGCLQESTITRGSTQTPANIKEDITFRNAMTTVGMPEIDFSSHDPWIFVGPICLALLIVAVIMFALILLRRRKDRKRKWSVRYNNPDISYIPRDEILTTNNEDYYATTDTTPLVAPLKNKKFKDNRFPIASTWPKACALERYNDTNISYISRGEFLTTNNEGYYATTDTTPLVAPLKNKKFKDNRSPIVSTWPKACALEREAIFQWNPIYQSEPDAQT